MTDRAERGSIPDAILVVLRDRGEAMTPSQLDEAIPDEIEHSLSGVKSACIRMASPKKRQLFNHDGAYWLSPDLPGKGIIEMAPEAPDSRTRTPTRQGVHLVEFVGPLGVVARLSVYVEQVGSPVQLGVETTTEEHMA